MAEKKYIECEAAIKCCTFGRTSLGLVDELRRLPAADVRPVVRGKWTDKRTIEHDGEWYCTACGKEITIYMGADRKDRYAYCPNCGADMREES